MNEVITRLNEIEEKANSIIEDADNRKLQMEEQLKQEKKETDDRLEQMENRRLAEFEAQLKREAGEQVSKLGKQNESALSNLRENFEKNKERMADEIFQRIIE